VANTITKQRLKHLKRLPIWRYSSYWSHTVTTSPYLRIQRCDTGLNREGLYRSLSADGNPEFGTVLKVVKALGLSLQVAFDADRKGQI
jgi:hypothetical protein